MLTVTMKSIAIATATLLSVSLVAASVITGENSTSASLGIDWGADIFNLPPEGSYFTIGMRTPAMTIHLTTNACNNFQWHFLEVIGWTE